MPTDALGSLVRIASQSQSLKELRDRALPVLAAAVGARSAMWATWGSCTPRDASAVYRMEERVPRLILDGWAEYLREMDALASAIFTRRVVLDTQVFGDDLPRLAFSREIKRPMEADETMYCLLEQVPGRPSIVVLNRSRVDPPFDTSAVESMSALSGVLGLGEAAATLRDRSNASGDWASLRPSERRAVELVRLGFTNQQIALALDISPNTVRNRLARVFRHANVSSRAELVAALGTPPRT